MAKGAKYRRRSKPKTAKFKKSRQTTKPSPAFKVKVKKVIRSQEETKMCAAANEVKVLHNSPISVATDWIRVYPQLGQLDDANRRIGNEIYPTRLQLTIDVGLQASDNRAMDITVVVLILKDLKVRGTQNIQAGGFGNFKEYFLFDEATPTFFDGTLISANYPWNNDMVKGVARKMVRLCKGTGLNTGPDTHPSASGDGFTDCPVKMCHKFVFNLPVPKILKYDNSGAASSAGAWPNNDHYHYAVGYYYNNIDQPADEVATALKVSSISRLWYKDG